LLIVGFILISIYCLQDLQYGAYIYASLSILIASRLSQKERQEFLRHIFSIKNFYKVRLIENVALALPFMVMLSIYHHYIIMICVAFVVFFMAFVQMKSWKGRPLPLPPFIRSFEFIEGIRKTIVGIVLLNILVLIGVNVENINLALFGIIAQFILFYTYYFNVESEIIVWQHKESPHIFLLRKLLYFIKYSTIIVALSSFIISIFFPEKIGVLLSIIGLAYVYAFFVISCKYSTFPHGWQLSQMIVLGISLWFPPLLILVIPYAYLKAHQRLKYYLS